VDTFPRRIYRLGDRALTTSQLRSEVPDVPAGSLYRHIAKLVDAGVLSVVSERRVRGAVERTYVLRASAARLNLGCRSSSGGRGFESRRSRLQ
jgi:hypothetical protein